MNLAAYCVKCKEYTDPSSSKTVVLKNNSRAMTGVCPKCQSQVYKIMPKKTVNSTVSSVPKTGDRRSVYQLDTVFSHTAYCVRCKKKTQVEYAHGIIFKNGRKALRGQCDNCGCDAYKILKEKIIIRDVSASRKLTATATKRIEPLQLGRPWQVYVAWLVGSAVVGGALAYAAKYFHFF